MRRLGSASAAMPGSHRIARGLARVCCSVLLAAACNSSAVADSGTPRWNLFAPASSLRVDSRPHPAVVRIIVDEGGVTASGSGSLVGVRDPHGLVVTNWHVVRGAKGPIQVVFPDGFRSQAEVLKTDADWDLAALSITKPAVEPLKICETAPQPGEELTIAGYGPGDYRAVTGRCTQYLAPSIKHPYEIVEVSARARQGDSGGPILNSQGELAGVLFGADRATTSGSYCGRVRWFLSSVWPEQAAYPGSQNLPFVGFSPPPGNSTPPANAAPHLAAPHLTGPHQAPATDRIDPSTLVPIPGANFERNSAPVIASHEYGQIASLPASPSTSFSLSPPPPLPAIQTSSGSGEWNWLELAGKTRWDQAKSLLAVIGLLAVWRNLSRWMTD